jgi:hypothetical protein
MKTSSFFANALFFAAIQTAQANDVEILAAAIIHQSQGEYLINVKLQHQDTGWEHYADEWRIVDQHGNVLGSRVLLHPHIDEQPFTRALSNVKLDDSHQVIYIEAHDKQHGWAKQKLEIDLTKMQGGRLLVKSQ